MSSTNDKNNNNDNGRNSILVQQQQSSDSVKDSLAPENRPGSSDNASSSDGEEFFDAPDILLPLDDDHEIPNNDEKLLAKSDSNQQDDGKGKTSAVINTLMADSGIYSMSSSRVEQTQQQQPQPNNIISAENYPLIDLTSQIDETFLITHNVLTDSKQSDSIGPSSLVIPPETAPAGAEFAAPQPPPRNRKKKISKNASGTNESQNQQQSIENQSTFSGSCSGGGNQSSAEESRSVTNSIESNNNPMTAFNNRNLASILDDIVSIKGDLSITECDNIDKRSTYHDDFMMTNSRKKLINQNLIFSNEQLEEISRNLINEEEEKKKEQQKMNDNISNEMKNSNTNNTQQQQQSNLSESNSSVGTSNVTTTSSTANTNTVLNQVVVMDMDTGEKVPLSKAENILPKCLNPLSLHLMKLTNTVDDNCCDTNEKETSTTTSIADATIKSVTSLISSTFSEIKNDKKDRSLDRNKKSKLSLVKKLIEGPSPLSSLSLSSSSSSSPLAKNVTSTETSSSSFENKSYENNDKNESSNEIVDLTNIDSISYDDEDYDDEFDDDDKNDYKDGKLKLKIKDLKRLGSGLIKKGVKGVKAPTSKRRSTFHVDTNESSESSHYQSAQPLPPRFKIKVNHKRGSADFDGLKLIQEINDCTGAIWCIKFSNCSQLLAAAGQDHLLRVYCSQKSWKYFTQLRNKASGQQHVSPNSTKERNSNGGGNGSDSMGRGGIVLSGGQKSSSYSRNGSLNTCDSHNNSSSSSSNSSAMAKEFYKDEDNTLSEEGPFLLFTIYRGHTADVLDLAWSKNHFLLSSSMDKTVRLWHITRIECLCTFRHIDFVTTIQFHPRDDRYFLSGSLDGKLRLWNIPDKRVTLWNEVPSISSSQSRNGSSNNSNESDMIPTHGLITASSFVQNGKFAVIGTYDGRVIFYTTDQLKYFTQIHVNNKNVVGLSTQSSGPSRRFRSCNKVTGIENVDANNKVLITTNDSRLRLYDVRDLSLTCKYKGCINQSSQIKASVSHDHKYIICGSENNSFYIWRIQDNPTIGQRRDRNKQYECIRLLNPPPPPPPTQTIPISQPTTTASLSSSSNDPQITNSDPTTTSSSLNSGGNANNRLDNAGANNNNNRFDTTSATTNINSSSNNSKKIENTNLSEAFSNNSNNKSRDYETSTTATISSSSNNQQQQQQQAAYSNAATKIVTSAIFASVPGQIEEKARYVIAAADFNGFIRIFSKN